MRESRAWTGHLIKHTDDFNDWDADDMSASSDNPASSLPQDSSQPMPNHPNSTANCWIAPGFSPRKMLEELELSLDSGGYIEQSFLYIELQGGQDWYNFATQRDYRLAEEGLPYQEIPKAIEYCLDETFGPDTPLSMDFLALGPGHGDKEARLLQAIVASMPRLYHAQLNLLDISQTLLVEALQRTKGSFGEDHRVTVLGGQGDMFKLSQYRGLVHSSPNRPCLIMMIGRTINNVNNEALFVRTSLGVCNPGDFALIEIELTYAPADRVDEIYKKDPRLSGKLSPNWEKLGNKFLKGPLLRYYQKEIVDIQMKTILDRNSCAISGSYAINLQAIATFKDGQTRSFDMMRFVRHEKNAFIRMFVEEGWEPITGWQYGADKRYLIYLFRKKSKEI